MLHALAITFRRPATLAATLSAVMHQTRPPDRLWVVDNAAQAEVATLVAKMEGAVYLPMAANLGPAGGIHEGIMAVLAEAADDDWVLLIDDDDPPSSDQVIERLLRFAQSHPPEARVGGVGLVGARYNRARGWSDRVPDQELVGTVSVDHFGGNQLPIYRVAALRAAGPPDREFFFGFDDLELGLRLTTACWRLVADGDLFREMREHWGRLGLGRQSPATSVPAWRRYYSHRNLVVLARRYGTWRAVLLTVVGGAVATPLRCVARRDWRGAWMALRGVADGVFGRMGARVSAQDKPSVR